MTKNANILKQFRSFCFQNSATDIDKAIEYFAVFGGMGWRVDFSKSIEELIEIKVLENYRYIHGDLTKITHSKPKYHAILSAIASGDRREYSAFKKANVGREEGEEIIDFLIKDGFLEFDNSIEKPINESDNISDKLLFITPFMRFWFGCISPYYKGIKEKDYKEVKEHWLNIKTEFINLIYYQLTLELVKEAFKEKFEGDPIVKIGSYYDKNVTIDILAKRKSGIFLAGSCKFGKSKLKTNEFNKLKQNCKDVKLEVEDFVIFSKNKFSNEFKKIKDENLILFSSRHIKGLLSELSSKNLLEYDNKKY